MRKKLLITLLTVIAIGSLSLTLSCAQAFPLMGPKSIINSFGAHMANIPLQKNWVHIDGFMTKWGSTNVTGTLAILAKTTLLNSSDTRQLSSAQAIWSTDKMRPLINAVRTKENFTYTFYTSRLTNASVATLSYDDDNFFMNGTWNVNTIVTNIIVVTDSNGNITSIHRDSDITPTQAYGELTVTDNWTKFTLSLSGIDPLTGVVRRSIMRQMQFNPFKVTGDLTDGVTESVTKADLAAVANCYGAMPGWGNYDQKMDFNFNYRIDIADLATVAANVE
jgi:hypothetical protein